MSAIPRDVWVPLVEEILVQEEHTLAEIADFCGVGRAAITPPKDPDKIKNISPALKRSLEHFLQYVVDGGKRLFLVRVKESQVGSFLRMAEFLALEKPSPLE